MRWLGLDATTLALTFLLSGFLLWLLYLQRQPPRRVVVPTLSWWDALEPSARDVRPGRWRTRHWSSFLLALAIVAALVFALGDPAPPRGRASKDILLVIDCSASMAAHDASPSRIELAKARARQHVLRLGPDDHAWVAALADGISLLTARTNSRADLLAAIDGLSAREASSDLRAVAELGADLLAPFPHAELVLFSDGALPGDAAPLRRLAQAPRVVTQLEQVGTSARNVAITQLSVRPYPLDHTHQEALVALHNFGSERESLSLRVRAGAVLLREEQLSLEGDETVTRVLAELPTGSAPLRAELTLTRGADALVNDDRAALAPESRAPTRVLSVSRGNRYLEAALLLDDTLDVDQIDPAAYQSDGGYDVVIFDGVLPSVPPHTATLYLGPIASTGAFPLARAAAKPELVRPFFDRIAKAHPLLRELSLSDVNIAHASPLTLSPGDLALAETRTHDPLIVTGRRADVPFVVLAFDLRDSDLPLRPAFPLFFLRTLDHLSGSAHTQKSAPWSTLRQHESRIAPRPDLVAAAKAAAAPKAHPTRGEFTRSWLLLVALALLLLAFEWFAFHRRWSA